jgi:hypothetical protein
MGPQGIILRRFSGTLQPDRSVDDAASSSYGSGRCRGDIVFDLPGVGIHDFETLR